MVDFLEKLRQVHVHHPALALLLVVPRLQHCLMGTAPRAKSEAMFGKPWFEQWTEHLVQRLLDEPVQYRWYA